MSRSTGCILFVMSMLKEAFEGFRGGWSGGEWEPGLSVLRPFE